MREFFPWSMVERIGVHSAHIQRKAETAVADSSHRPPVDVLRRWYF
jgi:hypothetical protein